MSLPSRERGLKLSVSPSPPSYPRVAPLAGARIEMLFISFISPHPIVAPLAGARIEIRPIPQLKHALLVAPLAGARIEINGIE